MPPKEKKLAHADQNLAAQISKLSKRVESMNAKQTAAVQKMKAPASRKVIPASHRPSEKTQSAAYQALKEHYSGNGSIPYQAMDGNPTSYQLAKAAQSRAFGEAVDLDDLNLGKSSKYLKALVDPEGSGRNAGIPDTFTEPTFRYQSISEVGLNSSLFSSDGVLPIVSCPHVSTHFLLPAPQFDQEMAFLSLDQKTAGCLFDSLYLDPQSGKISNTELRRVKLVGDSSLDGFAGGGATWCNVRNNANPGDGAAAAQIEINSASMLSGAFNGAKQVSQPIDADSRSDSTLWPEATSNNAGDLLIFPYSVAVESGLRIGIPFGCSDVVLGASCVRIRGSIGVNLTADSSLNVASSGYCIVAFFNIIGVDANGNSAYYSCASQGENIISPASLLGATGSYVFNFTDTCLFESASDGYTYANGRNAMFCSNNGSGGTQPTGVICATNWQITFAYVPFSGALSSTTVFGFAGAANFTSIKLRYRLADPVDPAVTSIRIMPYHCTSGSAPGTVGPGSIMGARRCPELGIFNNGFTTGIRLVSMSTWVMYVGGTLNDVGIIHANYVYDRRPVTDRDHSYVTEFGLTNMGNAYRGKAPLGCYSVWKPMHERDIEFYPFDSEWTWNMPYNVVVLNAGGGSPAGEPLSNPASENYSLRIVANWEVITLAPLLRNGLVMSVVDPDEITNMFRVLQGFPMCMANDDHVGAIKNFFSTLWSGVKAVYKGPGRAIVKAVAPEFLPVGDFLTNL